jgi:hypothetical protein
MNLDQKLTIIYTAIGIVCGALSNLFNNLIFALVIPLIVYAISFVFFARLIKNKKPLWILSNTIFIFILVWVVTWIFLFNIWEI